MLGCFRKGEANDPEVYTAAIIATLTRYPERVAIAVTEPATGLPSRLDWLPTIREVRSACDAEVAPIRAKHEHAKAVKAQLAERQMIEGRSTRPSMDDLRDRCAKAGLPLNRGTGNLNASAADEFKRKFGVSDEAFAALPGFSQGDGP